MSFADSGDIAQQLKKFDPPSYFGLRALDGLKGAAVRRRREEVFGFLAHRYGDVPVGRYLSRLGQLRELQRRFEQTHRYEASSYAQVKAVDPDDYKVALLLSFVLTNHRYEVLEALVNMLRLASSGGPKRLLSIGFGTGYEIKLAYEALPDWTVSAYDISVDSFEYATDLLRFFGCPTIGLRLESFPLEDDDVTDQHRSRYGCIVACELLEHLERPEKALRNIHQALHPDGLAFVTMAINIAQEDHVFLYRTIQMARAHVARAGLKVVHELIAPVTVVPFAERDRERVFKKGNYVCYLKRQ